MFPFIVIIRKTKILREMQDNLEQMTLSSSQSEIGRHYSQLSSNQPGHINSTIVDSSNKLTNSMS